MAKVENEAREYTVGELVLVTMGGQDIATQIYAINTDNRGSLLYTVYTPKLGLVGVPYEQLKPIAK